MSDPLVTIEHMLPDVLFSPLDLDDAIQDTTRIYGARGVVDLLVAALTDRRVRRDSDIDSYLDLLKSVCRQSRRYREAIPVFQRIALLNPARQHEVAAELAVVHAHLGEPARGLALLESAYSEQRRLPAARRSIRFCLLAELAATVLRHPAMAREAAIMGRTAAFAAPTSRAATTYSALDEISLLVADRARPRLALVRAAAA